VADLALTRHGCHNRKPYAAAIWMQDGWVDGETRADGTRARMPVQRLVENRMSKDCRYIPPEGVNDRGCDGCTWRKE
jgi:hypothetical protein